jgi:predicted ABC-type transport system involved in lysophospholipase L1 biosynthesis ATPase subunit
MTLVIVTHDLGLARRTNRIVRMLDGRITGDGPST